MYVCWCYISRVRYSSVLALRWIERQAVECRSTQLERVSLPLMWLPSTMETWETLQALLVLVSPQLPPSTLYAAGLMQVTVRIADINDNSPVFDSGLLTAVAVLENAAVGTLLTILSASDADSEPDSVAIQYSITAGNSGGEQYVRACMVGGGWRVWDGITVRGTPQLQV